MTRPHLRTALIIALDRLTIIVRQYSNHTVMVLGISSQVIAWTAPSYDTLHAWYLV